MCYERDRDRLLSFVSPCDCPADALPGILDTLGYVQRSRYLPGPRQYAAVDPWESTVWICSGLGSKLKYTKAAEAVRVFSLAHELAHIRLHLKTIYAGRMAERHEREADRYAGLFLMPEWHLAGLDAYQDLLARLRLRAPSPALWEPVGQLAKACKVSRAAMVVRLAELRLLRHDQQTRTLAAA